MNELMTDLWALLLPAEWHAEQEDETVVITDSEEVSIIEISDVYLEEGQAMEQLLSDLGVAQQYPTRLAELDVTYQEFDEEGMYWREWFVQLDVALLVISHGCDLANKGMDDASVDEILSTLALKK